MREVIQCFIFWICISHYSHAQNYLWTKSLGANSEENKPVCFVQDDGTSIIGWNAYQISRIDSIQSAQFKKSTFPLVSKLDSNGYPLWLFQPDSFNGFVQLSDITVSEKTQNIFISGIFSGFMKISGQQWTNTDLNRNTGFICKVDQNGNFKSFYLLENTNATIQFFKLDIKKNDELNIPCSIRPANSTVYSNTDFSFSTNLNSSVILTFDSLLRPIKSSDLIIGYFAHWNTIKNTSNQYIFLLNVVGSLTINSTQYTSEKNRTIYSIILDSSLKIKNVKFLAMSEYLFVNDVTRLQNGKIIIGGTLTDTIYLNDNSQFSIPSNRNHVALWAAFDENFDFDWIKFPNSISGIKGNHDIFSLTSNNDFYYGGGWLRGDNVYDDFNLPDSMGRLWFFKGDSYGNILWMRRINPSPKGSSGFNDISSNRSGTVLFSGIYSDTSLINGKSYVSQGSQDILLICIKDIEIHRGFVSSGPYCAGDSLNIPFAVNGTFDTSNQFIAQISDEHGNFSGSERELGRIKSNSDSVVRGILPLFDIASSPNYRIRIISTNPVVQSYYKSDTLRLLVYSKDTANAGKDTSICYGNTLFLNTSGGSRWHWSPGSFVNDSTKKEPIFIGTQNTRMRIIISDSSGCGITDTAYKEITIKKPLKILNSDTLVCANIPIMLSMIASGGNSSTYQYQWLDSFRQKLSDSQEFYYTPFTNSRLNLVLQDGCSNKADTVSIQVSIPEKINFQNVNDSLICRNSQLIPIIQSWGGIGAHFIRWISPIDTLIHSDSSIVFTVNDNTRFKFQISDQCKEKSDTGIFEYVVAKDTRLSPVSDTSVCSGSTNLFYAKPNRGIAPYQSTWRVSTNKNVEEHIGDSLRLIIRDTCKVHLQVMDYCGILALDSFTISPLPLLHLNYFGDTLICPRENVHLKASISGGLKPKISLLRNNTLLTTSSGSNIDTQSNHQTSDTFLLIGHDDCTIPNDTLYVAVKHHKEVNAEFLWDPENPTIFDTLKLSPLDPNLQNYRWFLNYKEIALLQAPGLFQIRNNKDGIITITLVGVSNQSCTDSSQTSVYFMDGDFVFIPSAFSPNDDGLNDVFKPLGKSVHTFQINIFDRYHSLIFKGAPNEPWNGTTRSGIDQYLYIILVETEYGKKYEFKGMVSLVW